MPIYEYKCLNCSEKFEAFQKITDQPLTECKYCRGKVEKLISHSSFQLKGTGWYLTDYANRSHSPASSSETSKSGDKPSAGNAAKPATSSPKKD